MKSILEANDAVRADQLSGLSPLAIIRWAGSGKSTTVNLIAALILAAENAQVSNLAQMLGAGS
jgi:ABC-type thiamine transport system ATPase subunit